MPNVRFRQRKFSHPCFSLSMLGTRVWQSHTDFKHVNRLTGFSRAPRVRKSHVLKYFSLHENQDLKPLWQSKARLDAPCNYKVRKKLKKVFKILLKINYKAFRSAAKIPEEQQRLWTISKKKSLASNHSGEPFFFMNNRLRCHLVNIIMKRKLFRKEC